MFDTVTQRSINTSLVKKAVTVRFADSADTLNYIYCVVTNDEGYLQFKNLRNDKRYSVNYSESIDGKLYIASALRDVSNDSCRLFSGLAMTGQSGALFSVTDSSGIALSGADICVFSSPIRYNNTTCDGINFSNKSDQYGKQSKFNLPFGITLFSPK